jgi:hypothetical protein
VIIPHQADPIAELEACGIAYVEYARSHSSHYRVMFGAHRGDRDRFPQLEQASKESFGILLRIITEGQLIGVF